MGILIPKICVALFFYVIYAPDKRVSVGILCTKVCTTYNNQKAKYNSSHGNLNFAPDFFVGAVPNNFDLSTGGMYKYTSAVTLGEASANWSVVVRKLNR